jgi:hypothetical protein
VEGLMSYSNPENFKTTISSKTYQRPKKLETEESFQYLCSMLTNGGCTCEIKSRIAMEKAALNKKRAFFVAKWTWN